MKREVRKLLLDPFFWQKLDCFIPVGGTACDVIFVPSGNELTSLVCLRVYMLTQCACTKENPRIYCDSTVLEDSNEAFTAHPLGSSKAVYSPSHGHPDAVMVEKEALFWRQLISAIQRRFFSVLIPYKRPAKVSL